MYRSYFFRCFALLLLPLLWFFPIGCFNHDLPAGPRAVPPNSGAVTTLAGSAGVTGSADGTGPNASFNNPMEIAVDPQGSVYVADTGNHLVRKVTAGGVVTTLAGSGSVGSANGTGTAASFYYPYGVAVDPQGSVYCGYVQ